MFNLSGLIKMINTNEDQFIQKEEVDRFLNKTKSLSIFNEYLQSINEQIDVWEFKEQIEQIAEDCREQTGNEAGIIFKDKKYEEEYKKCTQEVINEIRDDAIRNYGYLAKDRNAFNQLFSEILKDASRDGNISRFYIQERLKQIPLKEPITINAINESDVFNFCLPKNPVDAKIDWSASRNVFNYLSYYETTFANTPKENLPEGYNPQKVFDNGKSIGLGIDKVHNMGYTGQGVSYVIIDSCPLDNNGQQHADIHYKEYYGESQGSIYNNHHGRAVSYIAQEIAPDADCYFYSDSNDDYNRAILDDLKEILVKNKSLPDNQKIRFISHSGPISQGEEEKQIIAELEAQGIWVFYSGCPEDIKYHGYLTKIDPQGSSDDFNNYQIGYLRGMRIQADGSIVNQDYNDILFVNSGNRTVPDHTSLTGYRHDSRASQSWSIPVLAGYYTLACQADPKMTKEKFLQMADKTAYIKETTIPIYKEIEGKENAEYVGQTKETVQIKIIDINALLQAIEAEKSQ